MATTPPKAIRVNGRVYRLAEESWQAKAVVDVVDALEDMLVGNGKLPPSDPRTRVLDIALSSLYALAALYNNDHEEADDFVRRMRTSIPQLHDDLQQADLL